MKKRGQVSLDNPITDKISNPVLDDLTKKRKIKKNIVVAIVVAILIILVTIGVLAYNYFKSPEKQIGFGANIEQFVIAEDGKNAYVKLSGGVNTGNITSVNFIFKDSSEKEYNYETTEGIGNIEVPYKTHWWNFFIKPELLGNYDYIIFAGKTGLDNFNQINEVSVLFKYKTSEGTEIETPKLDTKKPTTAVNRKISSGGGGGGGGGSGTSTETTTTTPSCTPTLSCTNYLLQCGTALSDGCSNVLNCSGNCNSNQSCVNGTCSQIINSNENIYTIIAIAEQNGSISESGISIVNQSQNKTYTITSDAGFLIIDVLVDSVSKGGINSYTFINVSANHTIIARFIETGAITYKIVASAGSGGSITPSGNIIVGYGTNQTFNIIPNTGYHNVATTADGAYRGAISSFTFTNINKNLTISSTFDINSYSLIITSDSGDVNITPNQMFFDYLKNATIHAIPNPGFTFTGWSGDYSGNENPVIITIDSSKNLRANYYTDASYTITANAEAGGIISSTGVTNINYGQSRTYIITPNPGYYIEDVVIDNVSRGGYTNYTFENIIGSHTINASFAIGDYKTPMMPETFDTSYNIPIGGKTWYVNDSGNSNTNGINLQNAINNASLGDVIVLQAGVNFTGGYPFKLPAKTGKGWIYIISSEINQLAEGNRVSPDDSIHMPKIISSGDGNALPAMITLFGAHNYRFSGIEFLTKGPCYNIIYQGSGFWHTYDSYWNLRGANSYEELPNYMVYDRCYLHSINDTVQSRTGINANGQYIAIIDSYLSNFKDKSDGEGHGIEVFMGKGPFKIVNNFIEASGENIIFGGTDSPIKDNVPSDLEIRGNYFFKRLDWKIGQPNHLVNWTIKNHFELKNAQRVLLTGNIFENNWELYGGQRGRSIVLTPRNQNGGSNWSVVQDVIIKNNIISNVGSGFVILSEDYSHLSQITKRILIENNLFKNITNDSGGGNVGFNVLGGGNGTDYLKINHNFFHFSGLGGSLAIFGDSPYVAESIIMIDNIFMHGNYGLFGTGKGTGIPALNYYTKNYVFKKNLIINRPGDLYYNQPSLIDYHVYPANNSFVWNISDVGFIDYYNSNFRLNSSSIGKNNGTDGKDLGPDYDILYNATKCTLDGQCAIYGLGSISLLSGEQKINDYEISSMYLKNLINLFRQIFGFNPIGINYQLHLYAEYIDLFE